MRKNIYLITEIKTIIDNCDTSAEVFKVCEVFKWLHQEGKLTEGNLRGVSKFSIDRYNELIRNE